MVPARDRSTDVPAPIADLQRWEDFGGTWQVRTRTQTAVTISMCRCDTGEEMQRFSSSSPELLEWLAARARDDQ